MKVGDGEVKLKVHTVETTTQTLARSHPQHRIGALYSFPRIQQRKGLHDLSCMHLLFVNMRSGSTPYVLDDVFLALESPPDHRAKP